MTRIAGIQIKKDRNGCPAYARFNLKKKILNLYIFYSKQEQLKKVSLTKNLKGVGKMVIHRMNLGV